MNTNTNSSEAYIARSRRENIAAVMRGRALTLAAQENAKRDAKAQARRAPLNNSLAALLDNMTSIR